MQIGRALNITKALPIDNNSRIWPLFRFVAIEAADEAQVIEAAGEALVIAGEALRLRACRWKQTSINLILFIQASQGLKIILALSRSLSLP